jgi:energy-coupling factor transporter ATP-binding protein EcfA2
MPIHRRSRLGLSYLPQEASIFRKLTVAENVRAVLELQQDEDGKPLPRDEIERRLTSLLQQLHVQDCATRRRRRCRAASAGAWRSRALATQPRFILLDEPFAGIDPIAVIEIQRIIAFLKSRGIGVLITDHNVRETLGICDHAFIISEAACWPRARRPTSWPTRTCAASTWASTSGCETRPVTAPRSIWRSRRNCSSRSACCSCPLELARKSSRCSTTAPFWSARTIPPGVDRTEAHDDHAAAPASPTADDAPARSA